MSEPKLFLSHASEDGEAVLPIVDYLESNGVQCWISSRDIPPRSIYAEAITSAMRDADACAVIVSDHANHSDAIKRELELASHYKRAFIPIRIDGVEPGPGLDYYLRNTQWIDYKREHSKGLDRIVRHLKGGPAAAPKPPPPPAPQSVVREPVQPPVASMARLPIVEEPAPKSKPPWPLIALAALVVVLGGGWLISSQMRSAPASTPATTTTAGIDADTRSILDRQQQQIERLEKALADSAAQQAASARAAAPAQTTATTAPRPIYNSAVIGRWTGQITYTAGGSRTDTWTFESDGDIHYDLGDGTWTERNGLMSWTSTGGYIYEGRLQGNQITGTRRDPDGSTTGTFVMNRGSAASAPTPAPAAASAANVVGRWTGRISYAAGGGRDDSWTFEAGGAIHYDLGDGTWTLTGNTLTWTSTGGYIYSGRLQGDQITGTRQDSAGGPTTGTFVMNRQR